MTRLSILNSFVLLDKDLTLTDLRVYGAICMHANTFDTIVFPKQKTIAERLGINVPMVSRSIHKLLDKKYIEIEPKIDPRTGRKLQNIYTIKYDIKLESSEVVPDDNSEKAELSHDISCQVIPGHKLYIDKKDLKLKKDLNLKNIKKENDFEQFYKIYTEKDKISNSKEYKTAENKFNKIVNKQDFNDILIKTQNYIDYLKEENKRGFKRQKKGILVFINQESWNGENGKDWIDLIEPKEIKTEEQKTESKIETQEKIKEIKKKVNTLEDFSNELLKDSNEIKRRRNDLFRDEQDKIFKSIKKDIYGDNEDYLENLSRDQKEIGIKKPQVDFEKLSFINREKEDLENELKTRSGELAKCLNEKIGIEVATELIAKMVKKIVDYERESKYNTNFLELGKIKKAELVVYISEQSILFIDCLGDSYDYISTGKSSRFPDVEDLKRNVEKIKAEKLEIKDIIKLFIESAKNENFIDELIKDYKEKYRYIFKSIKSLRGKREFA